jgi:hypothetical protein
MAAAVLGLAATSASAQSPDGLQAKSDLTTLNCKDVFNMSRTNTAIVLAYLQAHYRPKDAPPVIDAEKMLADGLKLKEYCDENPQKSVIEAADALFGLRL